MPNLTVSTTIAAPQAQVYEISQDYAVRFDWDPFPEKLEMLGGASYAPSLGGKVFIRNKIGLNMVVQFIQLKPPERAAIEMVSGPWFLSNFAGSWVFKAQGETQTLASFVYQIKAKPRVLAWFIEPISLLYFRRISKKRLAGLKQYCEQGSR